MDDDSTTRRRKRVAAIAQAYRESQEVMSICLSLGVFVGGGYWLDVTYGWRPVCTILGTLFGTIAAGFSLRQLLKRMDRSSQNRKRSHSNSRNPDDDSE